MLKSVNKQWSPDVITADAQFSRFFWSSSMSQGLNNTTKSKGTSFKKPLYVFNLNSLQKILSVPFTISFIFG